MASLLALEHSAQSNPSHPRSVAPQACGKAFPIVRSNYKTFVRLTVCSTIAHNPRATRKADTETKFPMHGGGLGRVLVLDAQATGACRFAWSTGSRDPASPARYANRHRQPEDQ